MFARLFRRRDRDESRLQRVGNELLNSTNIQRDKARSATADYADFDYVGGKAAILAPTHRAAIQALIENHEQSFATDNNVDLSLTMQRALSNAFIGKLVNRALCVKCIPNLIPDEHNLQLAETAQIKVHYIYNEKSQSRYDESKYTSQFKKIHPTAHQITIILKEGTETIIYMWQNKNDVTYTCIIQKDQTKTKAYYGPITNPIVQPEFQKVQEKILELTGRSLNIFQELEQQPLVQPQTRSF